MSLKYPCVEINLNKITHNVKVLSKSCDSLDINIVGVSKVFCSEKPVVEAMLKGGIKSIADSRIENLMKIKEFNCTKYLLRLPMQSEAMEVVTFADISLNSEIDTIKKLAEAATKLNKTHGIILMVDLGDLREGVLEKDILNISREILEIKGVDLCGIGTNLTCYGGVIPDEINLGKLLQIKTQIESTLGINLTIVSGGNSSSLYMVLNNTIPSGVTQLRLGEAIVLGRETAYGEDVENCYKDSFIIKGEIVEIKEKPSLPTGKIGMDAFGNKPTFTDKGIMNRAIIAIGRQDINPDGLFPIDQSIEIIGASSDHLILDITKCSEPYKVGHIIEFTMDYGCILKSMTSLYVKKKYI
jgi:predicted amino acid racemase